MPNPIRLNHSERRVLLRLLGKYQDLLESSMGSLVVPGSQDPGPHASADDRAQLADDLRDWTMTETLILRLEGRARLNAIRAAQ